MNTVTELFWRMLARARTVADKARFGVVDETLDPELQRAVQELQKAENKVIARIINLHRVKRPLSPTEKGNVN